VTSLISFYYSNIDLGYQYDFGKRISLEIGAGYITPKSFIETEEVGKFENNGYSFRIEPKLGLYRFEDSDISLEIFTSIKYFYTKHDYTSKRYVETIQSDIISYSVKSKINSGNLLLGIKSIKGIFYFEFSTGYGIRDIEIINDSTIPIDNYSDQLRWIPAWNPEDNGKHSKPTIPFNAKFGIRF